MERLYTLFRNGLWLPTIFVAGVLAVVLIAPAAREFSYSEPPSLGATPPEIQEPTPAPQIASPVDPSTIHYEDYLRSSCRLRGGGFGGSGTCFGIDSRYVYVLTCRHVVKKTKNFKVEFWNNGRITGKYDGVVSKVLKVDAAVILVKVEDFAEGDLPIAIPISRISPTVDSNVIISVGSPELRWPSLFEGYITGLKGKVRYGGESIVFIPAPQGGQSGAGIIQDGQIVGVLWGTTSHKRSDPNEEGYAVSSEDLQSLVRVENLFFTAKWCRFCTQMKPAIQELKKDGYSIRTVDYDLNKALAKMYGITAIPAYVNHGGEVTFGVRTVEELSEFYDLDLAPDLDPEPEFIPPDLPELEEVPPRPYRVPRKPQRQWRPFR